MTADPPAPPAAWTRRGFIGASGATLALWAIDGCTTSSSRPRSSGSSLLYSDDFRRAAGPLGHGWTDAHRTNPRFQDEVGIVTGGVADIALQGPADQAAGSSGWRGAFFRDTGVATGVRVLTTVYLDPGQTTSGGGPLVHCQPTATNWGIGGWYNVGAGLNWYEFGFVGLESGDFRYIDTLFAPPPRRGGTFDLEIRSVGGAVSLFSDGVHVGGPVAVPPDLKGSGRHGGQIDIGSRVEQSVAQIRSVRIERFSGPPTPDYDPPVIRSHGAIVSAVSGTALTLPVPRGVAAGELLVAIVGLTANVTPAAPPGWTFSALFDSGGSGPRLACYRRIAGPGEPADVTWRYAETDAVGMVLRVSGANRRVPLTSAFESNPSSTSAPSAAQQITGLHRLGLWACVTPVETTITVPDGFVPVAQTGSGATAISLAVAQVPDWGRFRRPITPPFDPARSSVAPAGRLGRAAPSETLNAQILPQPNDAT